MVRKSTKKAGKKAHRGRKSQEEYYSEINRSEEMPSKYEENWRS